MFSSNYPYKSTILLFLVHTAFPSTLRRADFLSFSPYRFFDPFTGEARLNGVKLASKEACENHLVQFFAQKSQKFYSDGIMILPEKWQKVIDQNGTYIIDQCLKFIWINSLWKTWIKPKLLFPQPNTLQNRIILLNNNLMIFNIFHFDNCFVFIVAWHVTLVKFRFGNQCCIVVREFLVPSSSKYKRASAVRETKVLALRQQNFSLASPTR